ncbi:hypothetical protein PMIN03_001723 [Paraphaeosphaeria minitans]
MLDARLNFPRFLSYGPLSTALAFVRDPCIFITLTWETSMGSRVDMLLLQNLHYAMPDYHWTRYGVESMQGESGQALEDAWLGGILHTLAGIPTDQPLPTVDARLPHCSIRCWASMS